jgi:hypothetical protein
MGALRHELPDQQVLDYPIIANGQIAPFVTMNCRILLRRVASRGLLPRERFSPLPISAAPRPARSVVFGPPPLMIQTPELGVRIMRCELADYERVAIKPILAEQAAWRSSGERPTCPQWHFLGLAIRRTPA